MSMKSCDIRVSPQPIRNRQCRVAAFELLHRRGNAIAAQISDDALATDEVINLVYGNGGHGQQVLRGLPGFINVDAEMLFSSRIESLPCWRVVLELLETVEVDERVICRCAELKRRGFHLALDDVCDCQDEYTPLFDLADIVKVDLLSLDDENLEELVRALRKFPLQLLAEKVDSSQCAQRCMDLQFDLFQGYHFDPPIPAPSI
ncbi:EAL and HDOD domain-containing protein [Dechloromonas sp. A34]|uniref:EAL and HDOD domain-containing protein n=1 Tax=Dechloromonas sp. A34 TaxID=447588 RepID=UPI002248AE3B|nr:EAL domain-containing protein [Dechloromonas sp. A34]